MALPDLTGLNIQDTYQRLLQRSGSGDITDGTGSLFIPPTASFAISASYAVSASHEIIKEISSSHADIADGLTSQPSIHITNITAQKFTAGGRPDGIPLPLAGFKGDSGAEVIAVPMFSPSDGKFGAGEFQLDTAGTGGDEITVAYYKGEILPEHIQKRTKISLIPTLIARLRKLGFLDQEIFSTVRKILSKKKASGEKDWKWFKEGGIISLVN